MPGFIESPRELKGCISALDSGLVRVGTPRSGHLNGFIGEQVVSFGHAPWMIVRADVEVAIANLSLKTARILDANGMPVNEIPLKSAAGRKTFQFPPDALYFVLP
jgi:hypothetical protein